MRKELSQMMELIPLTPSLHIFASTLWGGLNICTAQRRKQALLEIDSGKVHITAYTTKIIKLYTLSTNKITL